MISLSEGAIDPPRMGHKVGGQAYRLYLCLGGVAG